MMSVNRIAEYNTEMYRNMQIKNTERRLDELRLEERRNKQIREVSEQARIEMNIRMNRPGQNVDKLC
jgi:prephenate dehydrogenase